MATKAIAHTSYGVETVSILQPGRLDALATWLCEEDAYHDKADAFHGVKNTDWSQQQFDRQVKCNGGYCDDCRNHAGAILAHFDLREVSDGA